MILVFLVEYNAHFPLDAAITFPSDRQERGEGDRGYGAALKALTMVAQKHGYPTLRDLVRGMAPHGGKQLLRGIITRG